MADVTINYEGNAIATMSASGTKTLLTEGKYCTDDIEVVYVQPSGGGYSMDEICSVTLGAGNVIISPITGPVDITVSATRVWCLTETGITALTIRATGNISGYAVRERTASNCKNLADVLIFSAVTAGIATYAFQNCPALTRVRIVNTMTPISGNVFASCSNLTDIYVSWSSGAVANAPWGATNATIHYDTVFDSDGGIVS